MASTRFNALGGSRRSTGRRLIAVVSAFVTMLGLALAGAAFGAGVANASAGDPAGITSTMLVNGIPVQSGQTLHAGDPFDLKVQYDNTNVQPGSTVTFNVGANMTITQVPSANSSIESVTRNGNQITVKFKSPLPPDVTQGVFDIKGTVNNPDQSGPDDVTWNVNSGQNSVPVTVIRQGDTPPPTTPADAKSVSPTDLNKYVHVAADGTVTMDPTIANQAISYTLTLTSTEAQTNFPISDQLPSYLGYDAGSFTSTLTTWDANGLNKSTSASAAYPVTINGDSFTSTVTVPGAGARDPNGPSVLTIKYTVHVTDPDGLAAALQAQLEGQPGGTSRTVALPNTASFNGHTDQATVNAQGTVPSGPCALCATFTKASSWDSRNVLTDADGNLTPPQEITYTLKPTVSTTSDTLPVNAVLSDPLPSGASWDTADDAVTGVPAPGTHAPATACADPATFAGDAYVGQWCVNGQTLYVNLGKAKSTSATINAKALVNSVSGLTQGGTTTIDGATPYQLPNTASLAYGAANPVTAGKTVTVVQLPANGGGGTTDASVFSKTANGAPPAVDPGESAAIPYVFKVGANKGIDLTTSTITDFIDQDVFGNVDLGTLNPTGKYNGVSLTAADFTLSKNANGNVVIGLSAAGKAIVNAQGIDKDFELDLTLSTLPFDGKVTKTITNSASLTGAAGQPPYTSTATSTTTSYGSEAEVDKTLYDASSEDYTDDLQATTNGAATYVYKLDFIPHGGYDGIKISPVVDKLPAGVQFLGFVTAANAPTATDPSQDPVEIGGNLQAVYDATAKTVTIRQSGDTVLDDPDGDTLSAYFAVSVASLTGPIVNSIPNGPTATIEPVKKVSVGDYVWVDANRNGRQNATEKGIPGVVLTITGPDGKPVTDVNGKPVGPQTTDKDGKYSFDNLPVLTDGQHYTVTIDQGADSTKTALAPYVPTIAGQGDRAGDSSTWTATSEGLTNDGDRDPTLDFGFVNKTYAVGDYTWIDTNSDGVQDAGEPVLPGVGVTLLDGNGNVVGTTTTDAKGHYLFDNLPAGTYQVKFQLTPEQAAEYQFTSLNSGAIGTDSDANQQTGLTKTFTLDDSNTNLTTDYTDQTVRATQGIDPTWDAGVVVKSVSVGDYVWVDSNHNGRQDKGEKGIPGVVLKITGPDGKPVTDVNGKPVGPQTTDKDGKYSFDNLPALTDGQHYTVTIDRDASKEALAPYVPTIAGQGDRAGDSSTWSAQSEGLTNDGDRDSTLDFGFVAAPAPTTSPSPTVSSGATNTQGPVTSIVTSSTGPLSYTGVDVAGLVLAALFILLGGVVLAVIGRRRGLRRLH